MNKQLTPEDQIIEIATSNDPVQTTSSKVRALAELKVKTGDIGRLLGISYYHANSVLNPWRPKKSKVN